MTFGLPIATGTLATVAAALAVLATVAYILKMRRRRFEVPFSVLWQRVLKETETTSLWRRLRRLLSLLLQLVILGLLVFAALDPQLGISSGSTKNVVIIVDASASMKTVDAGERALQPRVVEARQQAHELIDSLGGGDAAMVIRMEGRSSPLSRFESDKARLHEAVEQIHASDTPADLSRALVAAANALRGRRNPMIVLIGDGAYPEPELAAVRWAAADAAPSVGDEFAAKQLATVDLAGVDVRFLPIGRTADNLGIVAFNVRRYITNRLSYEVFIEIQNFGKEPRQAKLTLYNGGLAVDVQEISLAAGERQRKIFRNLSGGDGHRLRALLEPVQGEDPFPLDNQAYALLPERLKQKVLLVTKDHLYLETAVFTYDNITVDKLAPADYAAAMAADRLPPYDALVFEDYTPDTVPSTGHLLYFNPKGEHSPFPIARTLPDPRVTEVNEDHPVMRWVVFTDVRFDDVSVFKLDPARGEIPLARSIRDAIIAAKREDGRKVIACGFSLRGSDIILRVAFPLMIVNIFDWFAGDDSDLLTTYTTGRRFRVPLDATLGITRVKVRAPTRKETRAPISGDAASSYATFYGSHVGIHQVTAFQGAEQVAQLELAANLANATESDIEPSTQLLLGGRELHAPDEFAPSVRRALWLYLALAVLLLLFVEWITYNRRLTV